MLNSNETFDDVNMARKNQIERKLKIIIWAIHWYAKFSNRARNDVFIE